MIHYQYLNCKLLFIGINPHHGSFSRGVPFSNNKMFWYLLARAGIIRETVDELKNDQKLKLMWEERFNRVYQLGLINIIERPTLDISLLIKEEELPGVRNIDSIIKNHQPPVVCFIGKITFQKFAAMKDVSFGWQPDLYSSKIYVMHSPLRGEASIRINDLKIVAEVAFSDNL